MDRTRAQTNNPEARGRRWPLSLLPLTLALSQTAPAQISTDAGMNQAFTLPGSPSGNPSSGVAPAYTYGVDVGVGETDNVALAPTNRTSQTMALTDADFSVNHQSRVLEANAVGDFSYIDYLQGAFSPELLGRFDGTANVAIIPGRLNWTLKDDFGQSTVDPYTPTTPDNIENINYFTTGPDLKLRFDSVNFVDISLRYGRAQFQSSPFDSNRAIASLAVGRDVSAGGLISLDATSERVMFANTNVNGDFTLNSVFGRYQFEGARTIFTGELGVSTVSQSSTDGAQIAQLPLPPGSVSGATPPTIQAEPGGRLTEPLARVQLTRRLSASTRLIFTGGRILTDPASSFGAQSVGATGISTTAPGYLSGGVYRETYVSAGWQLQRNRTTFGVTGRWERDVYPGLPSLDSVTPSAQLNLQRRMSRAWTLQFWSNWNQGHYPNAVLSQQIMGSTAYDNASAGGSLIWHHGRGLEVRLRVEHDSYTVSNGNTGYHDNRAFLTIGYRPGNASPAEQAY